MLQVEDNANFQIHSLQSRIVVYGRIALLCGIMSAWSCDDGGNSDAPQADELSNQQAKDEAEAALGADSSRGAAVLTLENQISLGDGHVRTLYAANHDGTPRTIAVSITEAAANSLPTMPMHDGNTCFDKDGDGLVDPMHECGGGHERVLWFPKLRGLPFKWLMFNWQPIGHGPAMVFDKPHFDVHFFIQDYHLRNAIRTGPCGAVFVNCADNDTALKPVPDPYNPIGFGRPGAASRMGNHIADLNAPPLNGGAFEDAFVYGTYDGHITFWETVYATDWLFAAKPTRRCIDIKWAPQVEQSGYYPKKTCVSYRSRERDYLFTFEDFAYRAAG